MPAPDRWAAWLRERRSGGDPEVEREIGDRLAETRDRILDNAGLRAGAAGRPRAPRRSGSGCWTSTSAT